MWIARVTIKYNEKIHKLEIKAGQPKKLLRIVGKIPEEILEVLIFRQPE